MAGRPSRRHCRLWVPATFAAAALAGCATTHEQVTRADESSFSTRASDHENEWIVLPPAEGEGEQYFGYVYVDPQAGFTFRLEGKLALNAEGRYVRAPMETDGRVDFLVRLDARRNPPAARLPKAAIERLGLPETPEWLHLYKDDSDPITHRVRWGRSYNHVGACQRALAFLEPAYREKPDAEGLVFELAYAYNELDRPSDALVVLQRGVESHPDDVKLGSELAFALMHTGKLDAAVELYLKLIPRDEDKVSKSEMAMNLAHLYQRLGDEANTKKWVDNARAWAPPGSDVYERLNP